MDDAEKLLEKVRDRTLEQNTRLYTAEYFRELEEEERMRRLASHIHLHFSEAELAKKRRERAAKQARIQEHLREAEREKLLQRVGNVENENLDEIKRILFETQLEERHNQLAQFRSILREQLADKERKSGSDEPEEAKTENSIADDPIMQDDQQFFALAQEYIKDVNKRDRPFYPFIKAVEQYKLENQTNCVHTLPKLLSKILLGCREADQKDQQSEDDQNLLLDSARSQYGRGRGRVRGCLHGRGSGACSPRDCNGPLYMELDENENPQDSGDWNLNSKEAGTSASKIRYTISQLKYINQQNPNNWY